jgi:hypothetical protein
MSVSIVQSCASHISSLIRSQLNPSDTISLITTFNTQRRPLKQGNAMLEQLSYVDQDLPTSERHGSQIGADSPFLLPIIPAQVQLHRLRLVERGRYVEPVTFTS